MAAYGSALIFGLAFLLQLSFCFQGNAILFSEAFSGVLVANSFSKGAGLIILACGLFTVLEFVDVFQKQLFFASTEFYSLVVFAASGMLLLTMAQKN